VTRVTQANGMSVVADEDSSAKKPKISIIIDEER